MSHRGRLRLSLPQPDPEWWQREAYIYMKVETVGVDLRGGDECVNWRARCQGCILKMAKGRRRHVRSDRVALLSFFVLPALPSPKQLEKSPSRLRV